MGNIMNLQKDIDEAIAVCEEYGFTKASPRNLSFSDPQIYLFDAKGFRGSLQWSPSQKTWLAFAPGHTTTRVANVREGLKFVQEHMSTYRR
jgi:hypothetical protein